MDSQSAVCNLLAIQTPGNRFEIKKMEKKKKKNVIAVVKAVCLGAQQPDFTLLGTVGGPPA
jgi:hypothetical protein